MILPVENALFPTFVVMKRGENLWSGILASRRSEKAKDQEKSYVLHK